MQAQMRQHSHATGARLGAKPTHNHCRFNLVKTRSSSEGTSIQQTSGKSKVLRLLDEGVTHYNVTPTQQVELKNAIEQMIMEGNAIPNPGAAVNQGIGAGTWQVFWAPHISSLSSNLGTRFEPIIYKFWDDGSLVSNVKYVNTVIGSGWLSSSGSMYKKDDSTVEINFNKFWVDLGVENLRETLEDEEAATTKVMGIDVKVDAMMGQVGRAFFFPQFAVFPVAYMDDELAVFEFPPLRSKIAIQRLGAADMPVA